MHRDHVLRVFALAVILLAAAHQPARAVILGSGSAGNTDASSLNTYLTGGGDPTFNYFANIGTNSTQGATVFYLGNRWILTAAHVTADSNVGPVRFGSFGYLPDNSTRVILHNPDNSPADLQLVRLQTDPGLPAFPLSMIASNQTLSSSRVIMAGNGGNTTGQHFWSVNKTVPNNWVWTDLGSQPANPGQNDYAGFDVDTSTHIIRWGENTVTHDSVIFNDGFGDVWGFTTNFDSTKYPSQSGIPHDAPRTHEAHATVGDSGGVAIVLDSGVWKLAGVMNTLVTENPTDHQPAGTELFGEQTLFSDLSVYRSQIQAVVPEPGSYALAAFALAALAAAARRKNR